MDVAGWLRSLHLSQYEAAVCDSEIDADVLPELTEQHLKDLGVSLGHRLKMLRSIRELAEHTMVKAQPALLPDAEPHAQAERRQLTVIFCDLVGSTALSHGMDPEVRALSLSENRRCRPVPVITYRRSQPAERASASVCAAGASNTATSIASSGVPNDADLGGFGVAAKSSRSLAKVRGEIPGLFDRVRHGEDGLRSRSSANGPAHPEWVWRRIRGSDARRSSGVGLFQLPADRACIHSLKEGSSSE